MDVNEDDHQELEALDTLSLTDFPLTTTDDNKFSDDNKHPIHPPSPPTEDLFEFCRGGSIALSDQQQIMTHAEDMISGGKLVPINDQQPPRGRNYRARCESMREFKSVTNKGTPTTRLFTNSYSFDSKKVNYRNGLSNKSVSSRWSDLVFGPLKGPPEMDLRDIRNRQIVQNTSKSLFPAVEGGEGFAVSRVGDHRKTSWRVLGFLSCKKSGSVAVTMPLS